MQSQYQKVREHNARMGALAEYIAQRFKPIVHYSKRRSDGSIWRDKEGLIALIKPHVDLADSSISQHLAQMVQGYNPLYLPTVQSKPEVITEKMRRLGIFIWFANKNKEYDREVEEVVTRVRQDFPNFIYPPEGFE